MPYARSQGAGNAPGRSCGPGRQGIALDKGGLCGERGQFTKPLRHSATKGSGEVGSYGRGQKGMPRLKDGKRICVICPASALVAVHINALVQAAGCTRAAIWGWPS